MSKPRYISMKLWLYIIISTIIMIAMHKMVYTHSLSTLLQLLIVAVTVIFYRKKPIVALGAVLMFNAVPSTLFYATHSEYAPHYQLNTTMILLMCIVLLVYKWWKNKFIIKKSALSTSAALFALVLLLSFLLTTNKTYYNADFFIIPILYLSICYFINDEEDIRFALISFIFSGAYFIISMFQTVLDQGTIYEFDAIINRNYLSLFTFIYLVIITTLLFNKKYFRGKIYLVISILISVLAIYLILTYASRTAFIMLIVFFALLLTFSLFNNKKAVLLIILVSIIAIWWATKSDAAQFLFERFEDESISNASGRTEIAEIYLLEFLSSNPIHMLIGQGYKVFSADLSGTALFAHNSYLSILLDFGIVGFSVFIFILVRTVKRLFKSNYKIMTVSFITIVFYMTSIEVHQDILGICYLMTCAGIADVAYKIREYNYNKNRF